MTTGSSGAEHTLHTFNEDGRTLQTNIQTQKNDAHPHLTKPLAAGTEAQRMTRQIEHMKTIPKDQNPHTTELKGWPSIKINTQQQILN